MSYSELKRYEMKKDGCFSERSFIIAMLLALAVGIRLGTLYILHYNGDVVNTAIEPTTSVYLMVYVLICVGFSGACLVPYFIIEGARKIYYTHKCKRAWKDWKEFPVAVEWPAIEEARFKRGVTCRKI